MQKTVDLIDTEVLSVIAKKVRPVCEQKENESRRLWRDVTLSLLGNEIDKATAAKHKLEERQRVEGKARVAEGSTWVPSVSFARSTYLSIYPFIEYRILFHFFVIFQTIINIIHISFNCSILLYCKLLITSFTILLYSKLLITS